MSSQSNMTSSFLENVEFHNEKPQVTPIISNDFSKEIRITLKKGVVMKEHKSKFPIAIHILKGQIKLGLPEQSINMNAGDIIGLEPNVVHELLAIDDTIVRLSLSILDSASRVEKVGNL